MRSQRELPGARRSASPIAAVRGRRTGGLLIGVLAGAALVASGPNAGGYRFLVGDLMPPLPPAEHAIRWDEAVWSPGAPLRWVVANDPGWTSPWQDAEGETRDPPLESPAEVIPFVEQALAVWSEIGSADIRWSLSGVEPDLESAALDGRPTVFVDPEAERGSYAELWSRREGETFVWTDCDVRLAPFAAAELGQYEWWTYVLIHEFGHCLGLDHAGAVPGWPTSPPGAPNGDAPLGAFGKDPLMSYGYDFGQLTVLTADDRVGASLLRPAPSWPAATGGIAGAATVADGPASFVQVFAVPLSEGLTRGAVGTFTNAEGGFLLEGLEPGVWLLWSGPLQVLDAHWVLFRAEQAAPVLDVADQARMQPVQVLPGEVTGGIELRLTRTREGSRGLEP